MPLHRRKALKVPRGMSFKVGNFFLFGMTAQSSALPEWKSQGADWLPRGSVRVTTAGLALQGLSLYE